MKKDRKESGENNLLTTQAIDQFCDQNILLRVRQKTATAASPVFYKTGIVSYIYYTCLFGTAIISNMNYFTAIDNKRSQKCLKHYAYICWLIRVYWYDSRTELQHNNYHHHYSPAAGSNTMKQNKLEMRGRAQRIARPAQQCRPQRVVTKQNHVLIDAVPGSVAHQRTQMN